MFLSIGNDMAVRDRSIVGIFDLDNTSTSKRTREFLNHCPRSGRRGRPDFRYKVKRLEKMCISHGDAHFSC